jgi:hypothetical protein
MSATKAISAGWPRGPDWAQATILGREAWPGGTAAVCGVPVQTTRTRGLRPRAQSRMKRLPAPTPAAPAAVRSIRVLSPSSKKASSRSRTQGWPIARSASLMTGRAPARDHSC